MFFRTVDVKMFVAMHDADYAIVVWATPEVLEDIRESSPHVGDLFQRESQHPPHAGLWVWEGTQTWRGSDDGTDVDYSGAWRRPSGAEMLRAARAVNQFTLDSETGLTP